MCLFVCRMANAFELRSSDAAVRTAVLAAESLDDRQTWLVKLARVSNMIHSAYVQ